MTETTHTEGRHESALLPLSLAGAAPERFYFRAVDDMLFVFDTDTQTARALNAAAARLFLNLPEDFTEVTTLARGAPVEDEAIWADCLAQWEGYGWIERDAAGRVRLRLRAPRSAPPPAARRPESSTEGRLVNECQLLLSGRCVVIRLFVSDPPWSDEMAARITLCQRMFGFFSGFGDSAPERHAPLATFDLIVAPEGCTLRHGAREVFGEAMPLLLGKLHHWLLDLVYCKPPPAIFVHGAALATADGTLVLAGVSGAGKSTASAYLVAQGWRFGTDDSIAIGFAGAEAVVLPYPGAISLKPGSFTVLAPHYPQLGTLPLIGGGNRRGCYVPVPRHLQIDPDGPESRVRGFVFPRFKAGSPLRVEPVSIARAVLELMEAEFDFAESAGAAELDAFFDTLERLPRHAIFYGDLAELEMALRRLAESEPEPGRGRDLTI